MKSTSIDVRSQIRKAKKDAQSLKKQVVKTEKNLHALKTEIHGAEHVIALAKENLKRYRLPMDPLLEI